MTAVSAGVRAGFRAFNEKYLYPFEEWEWDEYAARLFRYYHNAAYYHNVVYRDITRSATTHRYKMGLYKHIRGIYNPVGRLVDLYVAKVYGGALDMESAERGAIPLAQANDALRAAIVQVWKWSNWQTAKSLFIRYGAMMGDAVIKVVDDRSRQQVRLEVVHPSKVAEVERDVMGNVKLVRLEYERTDPDTGEAYTYREEIDKENFRTFRNNEPFAFFEDKGGNPVASWPNEYGFVPMVIASHKEFGLQWGACAFHNSLGKIDELNDAASLLNDQVRKTVSPVWYLAGVAKRSDTSVSDGGNKDKIPALYGPEGSQPYPMVMPLPIEDAIGNIRELLAELERDMPELSLHRLREGGNLTAPGVRTAYGDAIDRIKEARGQYDSALVRAQQMAVAIGGYNRYDGFAGFNLQSYERGQLEHYIAERPVIDDALSLSERVEFLLASQSPKSAVWDILDITEEQQGKWRAELDAERDRFNERLGVETEGLNEARARLAARNGQ